VLLLLPPSEGKTPPPSGRPVELSALTAPELSATRRHVLDALMATSARPDGSSILGVGPGAVSDVERNVHLRAAPAGRAAAVYSGVLYGAAGLGDLTGGARDRAARHVRIVSALWGAVGPEDAIPAYRLSMGVDLPGVGPLARAWRAPLAPVLDAAAGGGVIVDCRSAGYVAAWRPPRGTDWVAVRVLRELDGARTVVSHHAKHARGLLTRHLLTRDAPVPADADELLVAAKELTAGPFLAVELGPAAPRGGPRTLTLVVRG
jgi:hypothetical protein